MCALPGAHEGPGHGRRLHDAMLGWLGSRGLQRLWLSTEARTRAQGFYENAGWHNAGLLPSGELLFERLAPAAHDKDEMIPADPVRR